MLRNCLIGSVLLHVLLIGVVNVAGPSLIPPESEMIFEMVQGETYSRVTVEGPAASQEAPEQRPMPVDQQRQPLPVPEPLQSHSPAEDVPIPGIVNQAAETGAVQPQLDEAPFLLVSGKPAPEPEQPKSGSSGNVINTVIPGMPGDSAVPAQPQVSSLPVPDVPPVKIHSPGPEYPWKAKVKNQEGLVVLKVEVLTSGKTGAIHVETSSGYPILDNAAKQAVQAWRYKPALKNGTPVVCYIKVPVRFRLEG